MKILLISMPDTTPMIMHHDALHIPNLGIASIAANVSESNQVWTIDLIRKGNTIKKYLTKTINRLQPDIIGLSAMAWQYQTCMKIVKLIKSLNPNIKIVIGGYHATLMFDEISKSSESQYIDYMIRGEGEIPFKKLIDAINANKDLTEVPSLSFKKDGKFIHNERMDLLNLDEIKLPVRDKRRLTDGYHFNLHRMEVMETSRGCTRVCNFCSMKHMYGRTFRTYSIDRVLKDIDDIYYNKKTRWIFIADDNLVLSPKRVIELCDKIIERKYKHLKFFVQADCVTMSKQEEMVKKMSEAGFKTVFLGIENVSAKNLETMQKGNIVEATRKAVENCHKYGMMVIGGLIFGLPEDDEDSIKQNYEFLKEIEADAAYCQIITPYPKTEMREYLISQGLVTNYDDYKWYDGTWANVKTKNLDSEKLHYLFWYHRQQVLGWWKPSKYTKNKRMFWTIIWKYFMTPIMKFFIHLTIKKHGWEGRYKKVINKKREINNFKDLSEF